jgi:prepilin-type N-terminal cleavage/methylation domain-containing protein
MLRRGWSLLELIVVLGILGVLAALFFPAVQRVRASSLRMACASNLRQIGIAAVMYEDSQGVLPYARLCPAPWRDGRDPYCRTLPSPDYWTGPKEIGWAPYDNRPGTDPTRALPGYVAESILLPWVENNPRIFLCPVALDTTVGSPTFGRSFQISYATNPSSGGHRRIEGKYFVAWDHMDLPVCASLPSHWTPWPTDPPIVSTRHHPPRHAGVYNVLHGDDSVSAHRPD